MTEIFSILKCEVCGNIFETLVNSGGPVTCCGRSVTLLMANPTEVAKEKHVPIIEKISGGYRVTVGLVNHPMEEKHYINWIELIADGVSNTRFLKPGELPVVEFKIEAIKVKVRGYCNLHGLWQAEA
ncbi:MAG: desulfoferrodoxin [Candidatus Adiutrix intracellularis]|jgi:superoxide reductase|nr:MAG: desulfoferrodoxin [Candidatus Adiutrix intracellularis]MDR2827090.1 desulfoferrodoxin [Candidatus Adiutrix intracellularis]